MKDPLLDKEFLKKLDTDNNREVYGKIIALNFDELPTEEIQGRITSGSLSIDGNSAVRRTCSITMVGNEFNIHTYYWGLNSKFKVFVGLKNDIDPTYPDIIWFPQGVFLITSFNTSQSTSSYTISIQGKDKMALLNGELGGNVTSLSWDFGSIDVIDAKGNVTNEKYLLKNIVREAVHEFAKEPYHNIIINDLDDLGVELLEYRNSFPLYMLYEIAMDSITNFTFSTKLPNLVRVDNGQPADFEAADFVFDPRIQLDFGEAIVPTRVKAKGGDREYTVIKLTKGETAGYRPTDLVYAGDLISNVGETITSMLDKIKNMLGDFEYFYNLDGQFVFQRKKLYLNSSWNNLVSTQDMERYAESAAYVDSVSYSFEDSNIITSFANTPDYANLKNDYSIWGARTGVSGDEVPVHLRCAIDVKPTYYKNVDGQVFTSDEYDWRELIYQMALDYRKYTHDANTEDAPHKDATVDFLTIVAANNPDYYPTGITGYEMYYVDMEGFWRQLYDPTYNGTYEAQYGVTEEDFEVDTYYLLKNTETYEADKKYVARSSAGSFREVVNLTENKYNQNPEAYYVPSVATVYNSKDSYYSLTFNEFDPESHWSNAVRQAPETINFWFDFVDGEDSELAKYSVSRIGSRTKAENDSDVKSIYFREVPTVIFLRPEEKREEISFLKPGYTILQLTDNVMDAFVVSGQGKSAKTKLDEELYNHSYCVESVNISAIPVYYLEPNTRVHIDDINSGINGDYNVSRINIPLGHNGTMSFTATKAVERMI